MSTPFLARISTKPGSFGRTTNARRPSTAVRARDEPSLLNRTRSTLPPSTALMNSLYLHWLPSGSWIVPSATSATTDGAVREEAAGIEAAISTLVAGASGTRTAAWAACVLFMERSTDAASAVENFSKSLESADAVTGRIIVLYTFLAALDTDRRTLRGSCGTVLATVVAESAIAGAMTDKLVRSSQESTRVPRVPLRDIYGVTRGCIAPIDDVSPSPCRRVRSVARQRCAGCGCARGRVAGCEPLEGPPPIARSLVCRPPLAIPARLCPCRAAAAAARRSRCARTSARRGWPRWPVGVALPRRG
eukprot:scaffold2979_cov405-Prasinococcus_capsulatus_cf.AAC.3